MRQNETREIIEIIERYFNIAKSKDLERIDEFFAGNFHKFGDTSPFERRDLERALMLEQLQFASVSDFDFKLLDIRIDNLGEAALATFLLESSGMVVDNYSFRGAAVKAKSRVTVVFVKQDSKWKMLHQHMSRFQA